jgi:hypothetical protein
LRKFRYNAALLKRERKKEEIYVNILEAVGL